MFRFGCVFFWLYSVKTQIAYGGLLHRTRRGVPPRRRQVARAPVGHVVVRFELRSRLLVVAAIDEVRLQRRRWRTHLRNVDVLAHGDAFHRRYRVTDRLETPRARQRAYSAGDD